MDRDEGSYAYVAWRWSDGLVPYRDVFEQKPPGILLAYRGAFALGGMTVETIRWLALVNAWVMVISIYFTSRRVAGEKAAMWASALFAFVSSLFFMEASRANTEVFMWPWLWWSFAALTQSPSRKTYLWSGISLGIACLFKPVAITQTLLWFIIAWRQRSWGPVGWSAVGLAIPGLTCVGYFASHGAFLSFFDAMWSFNRYYGSQPTASLMQIQWEFAWPQIVVEWLPLLFVGFLGLLPRGKRSHSVSSLSSLSSPSSLSSFSSLSRWWLVVSGMGVVMSPWLYRHYFLQLLPALTGLSVVSFGRMATLWPKQAVLGRMSAGVVAFTCLIPAQTNAPFGSMAPSQVSTSQFFGDTQFFESELLVKWLKKEWTPSSSLVIWGMEPQVYVLLGVPAPGEIQSLLAFAAPWYEEREQKWLDGLDKYPPRFMVYVHPPFVKLKGYGRFRDLADREYQLKWRLPHMLVMERKSRGTLKPSK